VLCGALVLAGCNGDATATVAPEEVPLVSEGSGAIVAEAVLEPARWTELRPTSTGGKVVDVAVMEGQRVAEGQLLLRFDQDDAELAVEGARAALEMAEAALMRVKASARPEEVVLSEAQLEVARAAIAEAEARRDRLIEGETHAEIAAAEAALAAATSAEKQAFYLHERTMKCFSFKWGGEKHTICPALGRPEEGARYAWHASQDSLDAAEARLWATQNQAVAKIRDAAAAVAAAAAPEKALRSELDLLRAGSLPEELAAAEADVRRAEASLESARAKLEELSIRAPFDATVVEVSIEEGEMAGPGQVLVTLASLDHLWVRTTDLVELDVVRVAVGRPVTVTVDALPEVTWQGHVVRIADESEDYRGDVTYPVIVELSEDTGALRWGMTALAEIDEG